MTDTSALSRITDQQLRDRGGVLCRIESATSDGITTEGGLRISDIMHLQPGTEVVLISADDLAALASVKYLVEDLAEAFTEADERMTDADSRREKAIARIMDGLQDQVSDLRERLA